MHLYDIVFKLNNKEELVIDLEMPIEALPCFCQTKISFRNGFREYVLNLNEDLETSMKRFQSILSKCLNGQMHLHKSLMDDLGYLHNECLKYALNEDEETWQIHPGLAYDQDKIWIGYDYQLWASNEFAAWMYNDENGAIIFEVTPRYPGFFIKEEELIVMPSYQEWMQSYKFTIFKIIPREVAEQWLEKTDKIVGHIKDKFDKNSAKDNSDQKMVYEECSRNK